MHSIFFVFLLPIIASGIDVHIPPKNASCQEYDIWLVSAMSNVTHCFGRHAQPFQICESCVASYLSMEYIFDRIQETDVLTFYNGSCSKVLLQSDKIQVLVKIRGDLKLIWDQSHCDNCYANLELMENGTIDARQTNETQQFLSARRDLYKCYTKYTNMPYLLVDVPGGFDAFEKNYFLFNKTACKDCSVYYHNMNTIYDSFEEESNRQVCMDFTDSMNRTRYEWSKMFGCHNPEIGIENIIPPAVIGAVLIIAFYVVMRIRKPAVKVRIMKQKRMQLVSAEVENYSYSS